MQGGEKLGRLQQERRDTQGNLENRQMHERNATAFGQFGKRQPPFFPPKRKYGERNDVGTDAVVELGHAGIFKEIDPPWRLHKGILRDDASVHQRPAIVDKAGMQPCDQGAEQHLEIDQTCDRDRPSKQGLTSRSSLIAGRQPQILQRCPENGDEENERDAQVNGEPVLRNTDPRLKSAFDHPPADKALQSAQGKEQEHARPLGAANGADPGE